MMGNVSKAMAIQLAALSLLLGLALFQPNHAQAQDGLCGTGESLQHTFNSGASWSLCADVSGLDGLQISQAFYQAPGDLKRSVMAQAQLSQILLHYHDSTVEEPQIVPPEPLSDESGEPETAVLLNDSNCKGLVLGTALAPQSICQLIKSQGIFARYDQLRAAPTESWELSSSITRETLTWNVAWTFTEDGQIKPLLSLSGRSARRNSSDLYAQQTRTDIPSMTRAMILATWRLVPALDTDNTDSIEQFDFPLDIVDGNRRPMVVTPLLSESFLSMNRDDFRGWRMVDESGAGYYLDPANNGFSYTSSTHNWANYTLALTREKSCELYAVNNPATVNSAACGTSLDDFVNAESLAGSNVVLWFSQTRHLDPSVEDWPVIRDVQLGFDLLPFDWTDSSPFELVE